MTETQIFKDELKQMSALNVNIMARNQELEYRLAEVSKDKSGNYCGL
jgi:hypothetical protein